MKVRELRTHAERLGFTPQDQVRWLAPVELWRAAVKVALASVFADYSDKREIQAGLPAGEPLRVPLLQPDADELWFDFMADTGDGFDPTFTLASLLAREKLAVADLHGAGSPSLTLPRASLLVLGGDEIYPTASARAYEDRLKGPFRAALPTADDKPLMVALPGNHDWYDGLTAFLRLFTQNRPIGGWQTGQDRSYFAVKLPQHWWLVGLDSQFGTYIDEPQLRYFRKHLWPALEPGDGIILCAATPVWVQTVHKDVDAFNSLHWFDRNIVRNRVTADGKTEATGASIRLWLTGDSHHYARYAEDLPAGTPDKHARQLVTCGLGGAYLSATHRLPPALALPPEKSRMRDKDAPLSFASAESTYPPARESKRLARGLAKPWSPRWLPRRNPGFGAVAAAVHVALFLGLSVRLGARIGFRPIEAIRTARLRDVWSLGLKTGLVVAAALLLPWGFRVLRARRWRWPSTAVAAVFLQVLVAFGVLAAAVALPLQDVAPFWVLTGGLGWAAGAGWAAGSEAFALYVLAAKSGEVEGWQMSGQSIEEHKGFVRMHIDTTGDLTLYPLAVDTVCHDWTTVPHADGVGERPVPAGDLAVPRLIEPPVTITRQKEPA